MFKNKFQYMVQAGLVLGMPLMLSHMPASAQETPGAKVEQLSEMQGDTALINAQTARIKAQAALEAARNELRGVQAQGVEIENKNDPSVNAKKAVEPETIPQVISIYGANKRLYALLRYPSGLRIDVRPSDVIDGDYTVKSITSSRVVLERGEKEYVLRTYPGAAASSPSNTQNNQTSGMSMPGGTQFFPSQPPRQ